MPDFDYLLKFKPSVDSHLILKSDQKLFDASDLANHFQIDKNMLNLCMLSIPFNERHTIDGVTWRSDELYDMQEVARKNQVMLGEKISHVEMIDNSASSRNKSAIKTDLENSVRAKGMQQPVTRNEKEEIQNWLDDVLDI